MLNLLNVEMQDFWVGAYFSQMAIINLDVSSFSQAKLKSSQILNQWAKYYFQEKHSN